MSQTILQMDKIKTILEEVTQISPTVANVGNHNVYAVPDDYFNTVGTEIFVKIAETGFSQLTPYSVPQDYFESLSFNIISKIQFVFHGLSGLPLTLKYTLLLVKFPYDYQ